jgi:hypothetical protein
MSTIHQILARSLVPCFGLSVLLHLCLSFGAVGIHALHARLFPPPEHARPAPQPPPEEPAPRQESRPDEPPALDAIRQDALAILRRQFDDALAGQVDDETRRALWAMTEKGLEGDLRSYAEGLADVHASNAQLVQAHEAISAKMLGDLATHLEGMPGTAPGGAGAVPAAGSQATAGRAAPTATPTLAADMRAKALRLQERRTASPADDVASVMRLRSQSVARQGGTAGRLGPSRFEGVAESVTRIDAADEPGRPIAEPAASPARPAAVAAAYPWRWWLVPTTPTPREQAADARPFVPGFKTKAFVFVRYLKDAPTLDGDLAEWADVPPQVLKHAQDNRPNVRFAWNNSGLFIACEVWDDQPGIQRGSAEAFWEGDCVELWLDPQNRKRGYRTTAETQQFFVWPFRDAEGGTLAGGEADQEAQPGAGEQKVSTKIRTHAAEALRVGARPTDFGWCVEIHLPIALVRQLDLRAGRILGLDMAVDTGSTRHHYWEGLPSYSYRKPDTWADVMLAGSDSRIDFPEAPGSERPADCVIIGRPFRLRVTDADMNVDDAAPDRLSVTVRGAMEDMAVVVLEETGAKTGIFEGSVPTDFALGERIPGTLELSEGEEVTVAYVDQARQRGERNVEVLRTLPAVAAIGTMTLEAARP